MSERKGQDTVEGVVAHATAAVLKAAAATLFAHRTYTDHAGHVRTKRAAAGFANDLVANLRRKFIERAHSAGVPDADVIATLRHIMDQRRAAAGRGTNRTAARRAGVADADAYADHVDRRRKRARTEHKLRAAVKARAVGGAEAPTRTPTREEVMAVARSRALDAIKRVQAARTWLAEVQAKCDVAVADEATARANGDAHAIHIAHLRAETAKYVVADAEYRLNLNKMQAAAAGVVGIAFRGTDTDQTEVMMM